MKYTKVMGIWYSSVVLKHTVRIATYYIAYTPIYRGNIYAINNIVNKWDSSLVIYSR